MIFAIYRARLRQWWADDETFRWHLFDNALRSNAFYCLVSLQHLYVRNLGSY